VHLLEADDPGDADDGVAEQQHQQHYPIDVEQAGVQPPSGDAAEHLHQTELRCQSQIAVKCGEIEGVRHTRYHVPARVAGEQEGVRHRGGESDRATEQHQITGVDPEAVISHRDVLTTVGEPLGRHRRRRLVSDAIATAASLSVPL